VIAVEHISTAHLRDTDLVLFPHPSEDPNDPLHWPSWRKNTAFFSICVLAFAANFAGGVFPAFPFLAEEFHEPYKTVSGLVSWLTLVIGLSVSKFPVLGAFLSHATDAET
jgi:hypothetical protein